MYINYSYFQNQFPKAIKKMNVLARTQRYFNDLYHHYDMPLDLDLESKRYGYEILALHLFKKISRNIAIQNSDYLFFTSPTVSLSSHHTVPELYFKDKLKWSGEVFDIRDCGRLCVFYAIHLILKMHQANMLRSSAIFSIENLNSNYVGSFQIDSATSDHAYFKILLCDLVETKNLESYFNFIVSQHQIKKDQYKVYCNDSAGFIFYFIHHFYKHSARDTFPYIFIIDSDKQKNQSAVLLIKWIRFWSATLTRVHSERKSRS